MFAVDMKTESIRKYRVAFICVKNSCRSQMAEAFARHLAHDVIDPVSGGTEPAEQVDPGAVEAMKEIGIDISRARPKQLSRETLMALDLVVHMGCGAPGVCLTVPGIPNEDWGIADPAGQGFDKYRETRDVIAAKVSDLADRLRSGKIKKGPEIEPLVLGDSN
ncbi:MAG: arsenate-mycothiol transferase ArsC [Thermoplasmata archaeon]